MRSPATDAARRLRDSIEVYIQTAQDAPRAWLRQASAIHSANADTQLNIIKDPDAAHLHSCLAVLYAAHVVVDTAAEVVALGGPNPLEENDD